VLADKDRQEACRVRKAIRELLAKHPDGLTRQEILKLLLDQSGFTGTRRNLEFQTKVILQALLDEKKVEKKIDVDSRSGAAVFTSRNRSRPDPND